MRAREATRLRWRRDRFRKSGTPASIGTNSAPPRPISRGRAIAARAAGPAPTWLIGGPYRSELGLYILSRQLMSICAASREDGCAALRAQRHRLVDGLAEREPVREPGCEAVSAAVRIGHRARRSRRSKGSAGADPATEPGRGRDDDLRLRLELTGLESLRRVLAAADEHVELDSASPQIRELARRGYEDGAMAGRA